MKAPLLRVEMSSGPIGANTASGHRTVCSDYSHYAAGQWSHTHFMNHARLSTYAAARLQTQRKPRVAASRDVQGLPGGY